MRSVLDVIKDIEKSKGKRIHFKLRGLNQSREILNRNFYSLHQLNKYLSENLGEVLNIEKPKNRINFQLELARHLHNYLASVYSLVEHTRKLNRSLISDVEFKEAYAKKLNLLLENDTVVFTQQLRVYMQHYELLPSGIEVNISNNQESEKIILTLSTDTLREFQDWKAASKRILDANPKNIDLLKIIEEYEVLINRFYSWFHIELERIFKVELSEFDQLAQEYNSYRSRPQKKS